ESGLAFGARGALDGSGGVAMGQGELDAVYPALHGAGQPLQARPRPGHPESGLDYQSGRSYWGLQQVLGTAPLSTLPQRRVEAERAFEQLRCQWGGDYPRSEYLQPALRPLYARVLRRPEVRSELPGLRRGLSRGRGLRRKRHVL